jgi:hypothetical protein
VAVVAATVALAAVIADPLQQLKDVAAECRGVLRRFRTDLPKWRPFCSVGASGRSRFACAWTSHPK